MKLKALILDVDGTMADTEEVHRRAFNAAFALHEVDWSWSKPTYAHLLSITGGKERMLAYLAARHIPEPERRALAERIPDIHRTKTEIYTRRVVDGDVPLRDGVARLMAEACSAKVELSIASTTSRANIDTLLMTHFGPAALDYFTVIGAGDDVPRKKPAPDIYQAVLSRLGRSANDCVAIEDSSNGLRAAKAAGLFTVVTPSYWTKGEDFATADLVLPSLGSVDRPLPRRAAAHVGAAVLGINEIDRLRGMPT